VEIGLRAANGGHFLTLSSLHWVDGNMDGVVDPAENATPDYIDPETGALGMASLFRRIRLSRPRAPPAAAGTTPPRFPNRPRSPFWAASAY
jgi:hypothetical protein